MTAVVAPTRITTCQALKESLKELFHHVGPGCYDGMFSYRQKGNKDFVDALQR